MAATIYQMEEKYEEYMSGISLEESAAKVTELMKS